MDGAWPQSGQPFQVVGCAVALVLLDSVSRVLALYRLHDVVSRCLWDVRGTRDGCALRIDSNDSGLGVRTLRDGQSIDQKMQRLQHQLLECDPHRGERGLQNVDPVDLLMGDDTHPNGQRISLNMAVGFDALLR